MVDRWGCRTRCRTRVFGGSSVMGTSGARNPTHTVQALAWRTADHIVKNRKSPREDVRADPAARCREADLFDAVSRSFLA